MDESGLPHSSPVTSSTHTEADPPIIHDSPSDDSSTYHADAVSHSHHHHEHSDWGDDGGGDQTVEEEEEEEEESAPLHPPVSSSAMYYYGESRPADEADVEAVSDAEADELDDEVREQKCGEERSERDDVDVQQPASSSSSSSSRDMEPPPSPAEKVVPRQSAQPVADTSAGDAPSAHAVPQLSSYSFPQRPPGAPPGALDPTVTAPAAAAASTASTTSTTTTTAVTTTTTSACVRRSPQPRETRHVAAAPPITMRMPTEAVHSGLLPTYKILVVGDAGVGKTNLLSRYCTERYDPTAPPTLGVEFFSRELDVPSGPVGQVDTVVVQLWDTAGQERSSMISSAFFRNAVGALIVYDVSRRETLLNVPRWAAHVRGVASEDCVCFVIGNKYDLCDEVDSGEAANSDDADTQHVISHDGVRRSVHAPLSAVPLQTVDIGEAEEIAHSLDMRLYLTSAKRGDGVLGAFTSMVLSVNAVQSVKKNQAGLAEDLDGVTRKAGKGKKAGSQRRKSVLDLRGFGSGNGETGDGSGCAC